MGFYKYYRHSMENWNKTFPSLSNEERLVALYEIFSPQEILEIFRQF